MRGLERLEDALFEAHRIASMVIGDSALESDWVLNERQVSDLRARLVTRNLGHFLCSTPESDSLPPLPST